MMRSCRGYGDVKKEILDYYRIVISNAGYNPNIAASGDSGIFYLIENYEGDSGSLFSIFSGEVYVPQLSGCFFRRKLGPLSV